MKIHSKFNDYYDTAMAYGVDDHVHYMRFESEVRVGRPPSWLPREHMLVGHRKVDYVAAHPFLETDMFGQRPSGSRAVSFGKRVSYSKINTPDRGLVFVGFCGKMYAGIQISWPDKYDEVVLHTAYDTDGIIKLLKEFDRKFKAKTAQAFVKDKTKPRTDSWNSFTPFNKTAMDIYFKDHANFEEVGYFVALDAPLFVLKGDENGEKCIALNPPLVDYEFQKVFDPYTAYQEIEMFMGGVLAPHDETKVPGVDDEHLAAGKGFDEWSFKTMPTKHKKRGK